MILEKKDSHNEIQLPIIMKHISKLPVSFIALSVVVVVTIWGGWRGDKWHTESDTLVEKLLTSSSTIIAKPTKKFSFESLPSPVRSFFQRTLPSLEQGKSPPSIRSVRFSQKGHFRLSEKSEWTPFTARQTVSASTSLGFAWEAEMPLIQKLGWPRVYIRDAWIDDTAQLKASIEGIIPLASENSKTSALLQGEIMRWLAESFLVPTTLLPGSGNVEWSELEPETDNKIQLSMKYLDPNSEPTTPETVVLNVTFLERTSDFTIIIEGMRHRHKDGTFVVSPWIGMLSHWKTIPVKDTLDVLNVPTHMECGWKNPDNPADDESIFFYFVAENSEYQYDWKEAAASSPSLWARAYQLVSGK